MSSKKASAADVRKGDDLLAELESLGGSGGGGGGGASGKKSAASKPGSGSGTKAGADPLADLEGLARSRPQTPSAAGKKVPTTTAAPAAAAAAAAGAPPPPPATVTDASHDVAEKTEEGAAPRDEAPAATSGAGAGAGAGTEGSGGGGGGGGGWWGGFGGGLGGIMGAASAAVKQAQSQAEHLAKELQKTEEAQRWAEHVKGNAALLRSYGGDLQQITGQLRSRALPGLTNLLHTLAPPISSHERLQVHITHDLAGYPSLDPTVHSVFSRIMAQVEGGDLMVVQRGHEAGPRADSSSSGAGWSDGPWWRDAGQRRDMAAVNGLVEGSKLARASAEGYAAEHFGARGGIDAARAAMASQSLSESNPTRSSDIFLAVQAVRQKQAADLFAAGGTQAGKQAEASADAASPPQDDAEDDDQLLFAIYLHDPLHALDFGTVTQAVPARWASWLDLAQPSSSSASSGGQGGEGDAASASASASAQAALPREIADVVSAGGLDPREWVADWLEECIALGVAVLAQRYVARRMGIGEADGGADGAAAVRGVVTGASEQAGAGELARAM